MVLFCFRLAVVSVEKMEEEEIDFGVEAEGVIKDVEFSVESISVSSKLPATKQCVYLNLVTKEKSIFCVELNVQGFRVSTAELALERGEVLLNTLSESRRQSLLQFANNLFANDLE